VGWGHLLFRNWLGFAGIERQVPGNLCGGARFFDERLPSLRQKNSTHSTGALCTRGLANRACDNTAALARSPLRHCLRDGTHRGCDGLNVVRSARTPKPTLSPRSLATTDTLTSEIDDALQDCFRGGPSWSHAVSGSSCEIGSELVLFRRTERCVLMTRIDAAECHDAIGDIDVTAEPMRTAFTGNPPEYCATVFFFSRIVCCAISILPRPFADDRVCFGGRPREAETCAPRRSHVDGGTARQTPESDRPSSYEATTSTSADLSCRRVVFSASVAPIAHVRSAIADNMRPIVRRQ